MKGNKGSNIERFGQLLTDKSKAARAIVLRRAVVKSIDWDAKTMTCTDLIDDLDHLDVRLGMGFMYVRPVKGSLVLIAVIGDKEVDTVIIDAAQVDLVTINGEQHGGVVIAPELKAQIDKNTELLEKMQEVFANWSPGYRDSAVPLKMLSAQFTSMPVADLSNIENQVIQHG